jgi:hypothetical protein
MTNTSVIFFTLQNTHASACEDYAGAQNAAWTDLPGEEKSVAQAADAGQPFFRTCKDFSSGVFRADLWILALIP